MNTNTHESREPQREEPTPVRDLEPVVPTEKAEAADVAGVPDAVQAAQTTRRRGEATPERTRARGVEWVRSTDLIARHTGTLAGRGIDFQAELARRSRTRMATSVRSLGDRVRRLPPLSTFGRSNTAQAGPVRSGVGMS